MTHKSVYFGVAIAVVATLAAGAALADSGSRSSRSRDSFHVVTAIQTPAGPGIVHEMFRTTYAAPIPGDRTHWSLATSTHTGFTEEWTQLGPNGAVIRRVVVTRSSSGPPV
jgi:hypothetical protein